MSDEPKEEGSTTFQKLSVILGVVVKIGTVLAVLFGFNQYLIARHDARVNRTLALVQIFNSDTHTAGRARLAITDSLWANRPQFERLINAPPDQFDSHRDNLVYKILHMGGEQYEPVFPSLLRLLDFYGELEICVASNLCDEPTALAYFGAYANAHWQMFDKEILKNRILNARLGYGLETFAQRIPHKE